MYAIFRREENVALAAVAVASGALAEMVMEEMKKLFPAEYEIKESDAPAESSKS